MTSFAVSVMQIGCLDNKEKSGACALEVQGHVTKSNRGGGGEVNAHGDHQQLRPQQKR